MEHPIAINDKISSGRIIKIAPFKKEVRVTRTHKHNSCFEIIFLSKGMSTEKGLEVFGDIKVGDTLVVRATDERKPGATAYWKVGN